MGAARAAGRDEAAPGPPRRASTTPLGPQPAAGRRRASQPMHAGGGGGGGAPDAATAAAAAAAAMDAAAAAAAMAASSSGSAGSDLGTSPRSEHPADGMAAAGEAVETLYSHPSAKIIAFTAGPRSSALESLIGGGGGDSSSTASRGRSRRSMTAADGGGDDVAPGTLPWSSQLDRTLAVGPLSIYRAPGSVAFLSCGSALQPILPKSQCWCIDEASSKFILQIRRPQYWRIEVPVGDGGENDERARRLRDVLDHILQFEKTPCPFKRAFTVALPEQPATPLKKKPWTPAKRPGAADGASPASPASPAGWAARQPRDLREQRAQKEREAKAHARSASSTRSAPLLGEAATAPATSPPAPVPALPGEFTRREWLAMLESQKKGGAAAAAADDVDEFGRRLVPALVAEHEQRIQDLKASEIEVSKMGVPWRNTGRDSSSAAAAATPPPPRDRALSMASDTSVLRAAWPSIADPRAKWLEEAASDRSTTADSSSSPFNSLRSWLSAGGRTLAGSGVPSSPPSSTGSLSSYNDGPSAASSSSAIPPSLAALYEDARRMLTTAAPPAEEEPPPQPRFRHRATTSSISVSNHPSLPPAVNIIAPSHLRNLHRSGRATTRLEAMRRIPGSIIYRVLEILLAPPSYLLALMLKIAARILAGEWRGFALGKNTDTGESIPVRWDYTDVDDPLGQRGGARRGRRYSRASSSSRRQSSSSSSSRKSTTADERAQALAQRTGRSGDGDGDDDDDGGGVSRLNVYSEADVRVYTDAEDNDDDDDDDDEDDTERCFSSPSTAKAKSTAADDSDTDTLSDTGGDPVVWTRRWAVD